MRGNDNGIGGFINANRKRAVKTQLNRVGLLQGAAIRSTAILNDRIAGERSQGRGRLAAATAATTATTTTAAAQIPIARTQEFPIDLFDRRGDHGSLRIIQRDDGRAAIAHRFGRCGAIKPIDQLLDFVQLSVRRVGDNDGICWNIVENVHVLAFGEPRRPRIASGGRPRGALILRFFELSRVVIGQIGPNVGRGDVLDFKDFEPRRLWGQIADQLLHASQGLAVGRTDNDLALRRDGHVHGCLCAGGRGAGSLFRGGCVGRCTRDLSLFHRPLTGPHWSASGWPLPVPGQPLASNAPERPRWAPRGLCYLRSLPSARSPCCPPSSSHVRGVGRGCRSSLGYVGGSCRIVRRGWGNLLCRCSLLRLGHENTRQVSASVVLKAAENRRRRGNFAIVGGEVRLGGRIDRCPAIAGRCIRCRRRAVRRCGRRGLLAVNNYRVLSDPGPLQLANDVFRDLGIRIDDGIAAFIRTIIGNLAQLFQEVIDFRNFLFVRPQQESIVFDVGRDAETLASGQSWFERLADRGRFVRRPARRDRRAGCEYCDRRERFAVAAL